MFVPVTLLVVINMHYNFSGFETVSVGVQGGQVCVGTGEEQKKDKNLILMNTVYVEKQGKSGAEA